MTDTLQSPSQPGSAARRSRPLAVLGGIALVVLPVVPLLWAAGVLAWFAGDEPAFGDRLLFGDAALLEMGVRRAEQLDQLVGCYSRFGFHHPGPLHYYLLAPGYALAGEQSYALFVGTAALAAMFLLAALYVTLRAHGAVACGGLMVALVGWQLLVREQQFAPWEPAMGRPAVIALVAVTLALRTRVRGLASLVAFAGSYALQAHLSFLPVVGVCWLVAGVQLLRRDPQRRRFERRIAVGVLLLCWLPALIDQVAHGSDGNLSRIVRGFAARGVERGYLDALEAVAPRLVHTAADSGWALPLLGLQLLLTVSVGVIAWRRTGREPDREADREPWRGPVRLLSVLSLSLHAAAVLGARRVPGEIPAHALAFAELLVLPNVVLLSVLAIQQARRVRSGGAWVFGLAGAAALGFALWHLRQQLLVGVAGILTGPGVALPGEVAAELPSSVSKLRAEGVSAVAIETATESLHPHVAGVVLGFRKAGLPATAGGGFAFAFEQVGVVDTQATLEIVPVRAELLGDPRLFAAWPTAGFALLRAQD